VLQLDKLIFLLISFTFICSAWVWIAYILYRLLGFILLLDYCNLLEHVLFVYIVKQNIKKNFADFQILKIRILIEANFVKI